MKIKINQLKLNNKYNKYKDINIIINDKKKMVKLFGDKYLQFLHRTKGTSINTKEDLIKILNRKPRSFLTRLKSTIRTLKLYNKNILNPKQILRENKKGNTKKIITNLVKDNTSNPLKSKILNKQFKSIINISKYTKSNLLTNKMNILKNILNNNKLSIPLNLLKPLLNKNINQSPSLKNKSTNDLKTKNSKFVVKDVNIEIISKDNLKSNKSKLINGQNYTPRIKRLKSLILNYNLNLKNKITTTKYFKLITSYDSVNAFHENIKFNFYKYNNTNIKCVYNLLEYAFRALSCLISKPVFMETPDKLIINLFFFFVPGKVNKFERFKRLKRLKSVPRLKSLNGMNIPSNKIKTPKTKKFKTPAQIKRELRKNITKNKLNYFLTSTNTYKLQLLCHILSHIFKKPVELDLIPLKLPFFDDNILAKSIGIMSRKIPVRTFFNFIFRKTILYSKIKASYNYRYSITRSFLAGIKIKIGGRLMTQRVIPKKSSRIFQRGAIATGKVNYVD
jgi:hypothetical protein